MKKILPILLAGLLSLGCTKKELEYKLADNVSITYKRVEVEDFPSFYIQETETTIYQYNQYLKEKEINEPYPYSFWNPDAADLYTHTNSPVKGVSINSMLGYCDWLSKKIGKKVSLPDYDEFWHALGTKNEKSNIKQQLETAHMEAKPLSVGNRSSRTKPVKHSVPSEFGVYDLFGNVSEVVTIEKTNYLYTGGSFMDLRREYYPRLKSEKISDKTDRSQDIGFRTVIRD